MPDFTTMVMLKNPEGRRDDAAALLRNACPMTPRHSAPALTFTHSGVLDYRQTMD